MIDIIHITNQDELQQAFAIREKVYIDEQQIDREDEFDEFEDSSEHFLAKKEGKPCGASRYRLTAEGVKLERFAVLPAYRRQGVAAALMQAMLDHAESTGLGKKKKYLNAQVDAMPLYRKFNFHEEGERFMECDIEHQKMVRQD